MKVVLPDTVVVKPSGPTCVPVGVEPVAVAYVPNAPISKSLGLKNDSGAGGGGGVTTAFEGTSGPANAFIVCDIVKITAKTINFFIRGSSLVLGASLDAILASKERLPDLTANCLVDFSPIWINSSVLEFHS